MITSGSVYNLAALRYKGVVVYHTYQQGCDQNPLSEHWFTTTAAASDAEDDDSAFDVRDFEFHTQKPGESYEEACLRTIKTAIDQGLLPNQPEPMPEGSDSYVVVLTYTGQATYHIPRASSPQDAERQARELFEGGCTGNPWSEESEDIDRVSEVRPIEHEE